MPKTLGEWVTLQVTADTTGYSVAALRGKIRREQLIKGTHWRRAPDGRIIINASNFNDWLKQ
jgi:hypothetical protein